MAAVIALTLAGAGCSLLVDNALSDKPSEGAGGAASSASSASTASDTTTTGSTGGSTSTASGSSSGAGGACSGCPADACCGGQCVDLQGSAENCGACGVACLQGRACTAGSCDPPWKAMGLTDEPEAREQFASAWTSKGFFVWGGKGFSSELGDGAIYDPSAGQWTAIDGNNAPSARVSPACVWTGSRVVVWGGGHFQQTDAMSNGAAYDPATDQWKSITDPPFPLTRRSPVTVWTGTVMLVWGGFTLNNQIGMGGGAYNPSNDSWTQMSPNGGPSPRTGVSSAWTGSEMILFGGRPDGTGATGEGYAYNPSGGGSWRTLSTNNAPGPRYDAFAVWMNGELLIWGGRDQNDFDLDTGARYNPMTDTWSPASSVGPSLKRAAPRLRSGWSAWTGSKAILVGGRTNGTAFKTDGAIYDPVADLWTSMVDAWPSGLLHEYGAGAWSGAELYVWGGLHNGVIVGGGESVQP